MRQIVIDELSQEERVSIESYLKQNLVESGLGGIYWLTLPEDCLSGDQEGHETCGPFVMAVELNDEKLVAELLVRSSCNLHCSCISYASRKQQEFLLDFLNTMLGEDSAS